MQKLVVRKFHMDMLKLVVLCPFQQEYLSTSGSIERNILRVQAIGECVCTYSSSSDV